MESASLATSGCIYRVDAIKKIGGFNEKIIGAGEDEDIEKRIRSAGWSLNIVSTIFYEQHRSFIPFSTT
jgi:GT2 family glycosyltransferase